MKLTVMNFARGLHCVNFKDTTTRDNSSIKTTTTEPLAASELTTTPH